MSILLVRHGETALNKARVVQPLETPLNARGRRQAALCATRLAAMNVHGVLASDAPRARLTADIIHAQCPGAAFAVTPLLRERNFGDLRGTPYADLDVDIFADDYVPPAGESWQAFEDRVADAFVELRSVRDGVGGNLVVVTHGLVCRAMARRHLDLPGAMNPVSHFGNTSLTIFDAAPPHTVQLLDSTDHLDPTAQDDPDAISGL